MAGSSRHDNNVNDEDDQEAEVNRVLFLRSIPDKTTEDELYELFLQAGPLEKVAIPQNKNMAFITYKHSVSAPYAKELFCDTRLHGRLLNIDFRTGSKHAGNRNQTRQSGQQSSAGSYNHHRQSHHSHGHNQNPYSGYVAQGHSSSSYHTTHRQSPYSVNPPAAPRIQGYRSTDNREYEPQFVSFESPPTSFRGGVPVNHPEHHIPFDERRQRLLNQQRYITQADMQRSQNRYGNWRR